jgi:hypothetical protein
MAIREDRFTWHTNDIIMDADEIESDAVKVKVKLVSEEDDDTGGA